MTVNDRYWHFIIQSHIGVDIRCLPVFGCSCSRASFIDVGTSVSCVGMGSRMLWSPSCCVLMPWLVVGDLERYLRGNGLRLLILSWWSSVSLWVAPGCGDILWRFFYGLAGTASQDSV